MISLRHVALTNPGHFWGCCGLFELAERAWGGALGWFEGTTFRIEARTGPGSSLEELVALARQASLEELDPADPTGSPLLLGKPFELRLDWWKAAKDLKAWAGTMRCGRIARAMKARLADGLASGSLFDHGIVVLGDDEKKVEPFYFDARRGSNALPLDVGFSTDPLAMETLAFPATEFLTLVGLQRFRPASLRTRVFRYHAWSRPLPILLAALATCGALDGGGTAYRFKSVFRTDQRKHKAFSPAVPLTGDGDE